MAKITKSETKYHHVVSALPKEIGVRIDLDYGVDYEKLKGRTTYLLSIIIIDVFSRFAVLVPLKNVTKTFNF